MDWLGLASALYVIASEVLNNALKALAIVWLLRQLY